MSPNDAIVLFAEISVALAGLAGVASALAGRDRDFGVLDRGRIRAIVGLPTIVLVGCLAFVAASVGDPALARATRVAAAVSLVACLPLYVWVVVPAIRDFRQPNSVADPWVIYLSTFLVALATVLYGWVALFPKVLWVLVASFSLQIVHAIWMFLRLLTRPK
ncbi:MAG: hypothetical protein NXI18_21915 [Alphaproteobacteria bacterium]|nr:hypothetical protein [Alphaproteobacteria bacterium]